VHRKIAKIATTAKIAIIEEKIRVHGIALNFLSLAVGFISSDLPKLISGSRVMSRA
jgi:hypothetical protein